MKMSTPPVIRDAQAKMSCDSGQSRQGPKPETGMPRVAGLVRVGTGRPRCWCWRCCWAAVLGAGPQDFVGPGLGMLHLQRRPGRLAGGAPAPSSAAGPHVHTPFPVSFPSPPRPGSPR